MLAVSCLPQSVVKSLNTSQRKQNPPQAPISPQVLSKKRGYRSSFYVQARCWGASLLLISSLHLLSFKLCCPACMVVFSTDHRLQLLPFITITLIRSSPLFRDFPSMARRLAERAMANLSKPNVTADEQVEGVDLVPEPDDRFRR